MSAEKRPDRASSATPTRPSSGSWRSESSARSSSVHKLDARPLCAQISDFRPDPDLHGPTGPGGKPSRAPRPRAGALVPGSLYSSDSTAAFSRSSEFAQRFLTSREAIGAASLPRPLNTTLSSTRREVPSRAGLRL
jgi:hypothetical protein